MSAALEAGAIHDRYVVLGPIGHGGMASVYMVRHQRLGSEHVLKVLTLSGRGVADRLLLEGQVQAQLKHPNVVEVTDVIDVAGQPGLVMELVKGPSLDQVLDGTQLPFELIDQLVPGILAGVGAAHASGVVHRDLKPANILLAVRAGLVMPKVADFGLVKQLDDVAAARTQTGATMGTPQYMAPEQIKNARHVDARSDLFALGAILYELVTGARAFDGDGHFEIFQRIVSGEREPVLSRRPDAPARMVAAIDAALRERETRVADCEALWTLWAGDTPRPLAVAAASATSWPEDVLVRLTELAPSSERFSVPPELLDAASGSPHTVSASLLSGSVDEVPPPTPTRSLPPAPPPRRWPWIALGLGLFAALTTGVIATLSLGGALALNQLGEGAVVEPVVEPEPVVAPEPVVVEPEPVVAPEPVVEAVPEPEPVAPRPVAVVPAVPDLPRPQAPAPRTSGVVRVDGAAAVTLLGEDGTRHTVPGEVPPGTYVVISPGPGAKRLGNLAIADGQTVRMTCVASIDDCRWK